MDDEDDSAALAHQMELEARQQEEEAMAKSRQLLDQLRRDNAQFETEMTQVNERINTNWRKFHGDHG